MQRGQSKQIRVITATIGAAALLVTLPACTSSGKTGSNGTSGAPAVTGSANPTGSAPGSGQNSGGTSTDGGSAPVSTPPPLDRTKVEKNSARSFRFPNVTQAQAQQLEDKLRPMKIVKHAVYNKDGSFSITLNRGANQGQLADITNLIVKILQK